MREVGEAAGRYINRLAGYIGKNLDSFAAKQGITPAELDGVYLAGGFGVYLDPASAAAIGMLPQLPAGRLHSIGNASLAGASMLALDASRAADALQTAERCRYIELSGRADFADAFTGGMTYEPVTRR